VNESPGWWARWRAAARTIKRDVAALYYVVLDKDTPYFVKVLAAMVVAYALSPIDLIPDFIPVLGYLDDLILLPLGIWLCLKLIPWYVLKDARAKVEENPRVDSALGLVAAAVILVIYAMIAVWLWRVVFRAPE
jgi:uncharacterized membrane protein YkvA (DUF1232 family)